MSADRLARVVLSTVFEPGDYRLPGLLGHFGADRLVRVLIEDTEPRLRATAADVRGRLVQVDPGRQLAEAERLGIRFVTPEDEEWPSGLADLDSIEPVQGMIGAPVGLWARGQLRLDELDHAVAIVGARHATTYGCTLAAQIASDVVGGGRSVVSGAAFGIDRAAHLGAMALRGPTAAVLACGVDRAYPVAHADLLADIACSGAVISELPPGFGVTRQRFLSRNRIIAALSEGVVVAEAAIRSGALNTATWAERLSRHVMAVPGPVTSSQSQGAHELIRRGGLLVTNGSEVLEAIAPMGSHVVTERQAEILPRDRLEPRAKQVMDALEVDRSMSVEEIASAASVATLDVSAVMEQAYRRGLVAKEGDKWLLTSLALRT